MNESKHVRITGFINRHSKVTEFLNKQIYDLRDQRANLTQALDKINGDYNRLGRAAGRIVDLLLEEIETMIDRDPPADSPEGQKLTKWASVVEEVEKILYPIDDKECTCSHDGVSPGCDKHGQF